MAQVHKWPTSLRTDASHGYANRNKHQVLRARDEKYVYQNFRKGSRNTKDQIRSSLMTLRVDFFVFFLSKEVTSPIRMAILLGKRKSWAENRTEEREKLLIKYILTGIFSLTEEND